MMVPGLVYSLNVMLFLLLLLPIVSRKPLCHRKSQTSSQHCITAPQLEATTVSPVVPILSLSGHLCDDSETVRAPDNHNTTAWSDKRPRANLTVDETKVW